MEEDSRKASNEPSNDEQQDAGKEANAEAASREGDPVSDAPEADVQAARDAAARLETVIADAERERQRWQKLPPPRPALRGREIIIFAFASAIMTTIFVCGLLVTFPNYLAPGAASRSAQPQEQARQGSGDLTQRVRLARQKMTESERAVWKRDCQPLLDKIDSGSGLTSGEKATWEGQCNEMILNAEKR